MKIGIAGCGNVGSAITYACVLQGVGTELALFDKNEALAQAQAEDISHATAFTRPMGVRSGGYDILHDAGIVIISAGVSQKPGETRLDLLKRNAEVFEGIIPEILKHAPEAVLVIATNPVDVMTHMASAIAERNGHSKKRVIGTGTILDTARFRTLLAHHLDISSHSIHANVLGEHGDSEILNWSGASIGNISVQDFALQMGTSVTADDMSRIDDAVRNAGYRICEGKGATWFGVAAAAARIARAITRNERAVLTCSTPLDRAEDVEHVTLSIPHVIGAEGIIASLYPNLNDKEREDFRQSAHILKAAAQSVGY